MENERMKCEWGFCEKEPRTQVRACRVCQLIWELKTNGGIGMQVIISLHPSLSLPAYSTPRLLLSLAVGSPDSLREPWDRVARKREARRYLSRTHGGVWPWARPVLPQVGVGVEDGGNSTCLKRPLGHRRTNAHRPMMRGRREMDPK